MGCGQAKYAESSAFLSTSRMSNVHVCVTPALSSEYGGTIKLSSNQPISCEWRKDNRTALLNLSNNGMTATNVEPGNYEIICSTPQGYHDTLHVTVKSIDLLVVDRYIVTHASSDMARDGTVEAIITQIDRKNVRFLWTSGVITNEPILHDVRPGIYAVSIISNNKVPIPFYHICCPANVHIKSYSDK
tara:strand:+ start:8481 stop:9044 length:564 start_codon:yes stop_codon:yes gene_type:complete